MAIRTDCYEIERIYEYDPERVRKAFEIILNIKPKEKEEEKQADNKERNTN